MLLSNIRRLLLPRSSHLGAAASLPRLLSSAKDSSNSQVVLEPLEEREIIRVKGDDVVGFLQGLVTNNMTQLKSNGTDANSMYAMFLNKNGRVLYDTIIYSTLDPSTYLIECDARISSELRRLLRMYRVRRQIDVEQADREFKPWVVFNPLTAPEPIVDTIQPSEELCAIHDPRLPQLGMRVLTTPNTNWSDLSGYFNRRFDVEAVKPNMNENYRTRRYCYGIAEGVEDMPPGKCFPLEANGDILNGVSFNKGCYVGQELTARVYHTGVIRKRVMPLRLTANPPNGSIDVQTNAGAKIGKVLSAYNKRALALMRVDQALRASELVIDGDLCYVEKPQWWPNEFGKRNVAASND